MKKKPANEHAFAPLWQTCANGYTPQGAAHEFAQTYWDKPRQVVNWKDNTFHDGTRTYRVVFQPSKDNYAVLYQIGVES